MSTPSSTKRPKVGTPLRASIAIVGTAVIVYAFYRALPELTQLGPELRSIPPWKFLFSLAITLTVLIWECLMWRRALVDMGAVLLPPVDASLAFFSGNIAKYIPGKVWPILFQAALLDKHAISLPVTASASIVLTVFSLLGSLMVIGTTLASLPLAIEFRVAGVALILGAIGITALASAQSQWLLRYLPEKIRQPIESLGRRSLVYVAQFAGVWVLYGCSAAVFVGIPAEGFAGDLAVVGGMAFAAIAGALVVFTPGGIGVREAVLFMTLGRLDAGLRVALPILTRVVLLFAETAGYLVSLAWVRLSPSSEGNSRFGIRGKSNLDSPE